MKKISIASRGFVVLNPGYFFNEELHSKVSGHRKTWQRVGYGGAVQTAENVSG